MCEKGKMLTVREAASWLRVCPHTVRRHINRGNLTAYWVGNQMRVKPVDLDAFVRLVKVDK